ncbi:MAG TPA: hypothetical protein VND64_31260 [Pirellulales bacterium]|nr:hypothetical protein [Pirellulales bacterium]
MEFYEYRSFYETSRKSSERLGVEQFYERIATILQRQMGTVEQRRVVSFLGNAELAWHRAGRPYYKLWPGVIPLFSDVSVDIPVDYLRLPFTSFVLRFPKGDNPLRLPDSREIQTIFVHDELLGGGLRQIGLEIGIGGEGEGFLPLHLACEPGLSIEQAFQVIPGDKEAPVPNELREQCLRIVVSVCFIATGAATKLIQPDVFSDDLRRYLEATEKDPPLAEKLVAKARRKGRLGWNIGRYEARAFFRPSAAAHGAGSTTRGPLMHQHQRSAHFRLLPTGKVVFVRQTTVRPDLPPPEHPPGYDVKP